MSYPSDLSDAEWTKLEKFFERPDPRGARSKYPKRRVVEAVLYRLREGCRWRALPHDFPPWDTGYDHWRRWKKRGVWQEAVAVLGIRWREVALGRGRRAPRHAILDSQSVKTAAEGEERGLHGGKKVKGRSVALRWRVERTFAWLGQCRLLSKEYEKTVASAEAWLRCAMMRLLVRRLSV